MPVRARVYAVLVYAGRFQDCSGECERGPQASWRGNFQDKSVCGPKRGGVPGASVSRRNQRPYGPTSERVGQLFERCSWIRYVVWGGCSRKTQPLQLCRSRNSVSVETVWIPERPGNPNQTHCYGHGHVFQRRVNTEQYTRTKHSKETTSLAHYSKSSHVLTSLHTGDHVTSKKSTRSSS